MAAAGHAGPFLHECPPKAIGNLCQALSQLPQPVHQCQHRVAFARHVVIQASASRRKSDFTRSDHALIVSALVRFSLGPVPEVKAYATWVISEASQHHAEIGRQELFNMSLACVRFDGEGGFALIPTYTHAYIHTYIHTCIHACIHTCIHTFIHTYMHTYIPTYIHTYIHTYL